MLSYETLDYENDIGAGGMQDVNDGNPEIHPWKFLKGIGYDWTHFYDKIDLQNL